MRTLGPHRWASGGFTIFLVCALAALVLPRSYGLAVLANLVQTGLVAAFLVLMVLNARVARAHARIFWGTMALGAGLWLAATMMWTWLEVVVRKPVPNPFLGDVLYFLHIVPMMGALALRPHRAERDRRLDFGGLDFVLLLAWWVYLYLFIVIPWQYVVLDVELYNFSFNVLYFLGNAVFLVAVFILCCTSSGVWRRVYTQLLIAGTIYACASQLAIWALDHKRYYSGSLYDLPLVAAMMWFVWAGLLAYRLRPAPGTEEVVTGHAVLASRLAMAAVLSLSILGLWAYLGSTAPRKVTAFRLIVSFAALFVLSFFVFLKQHLLDGELIRLLGTSQRSYENLKRLQVQLVQSEKLASLGQLVSGAAHEINNPLTAIIGYSDLLASDSSLPPDKSAFVTKIGQQARRTRELVSNLLSFAKQVPAEKTLLNINAVVADAAEIRGLDLPASIRIEQQLAPDLPPVLGDANQLLQVCFHIIGNAIDSMKRAGSGVLTLTTRHEKGQVVIEFADTGHGIGEPEKIFDPFYSTKPVGKGAGLGLSACYGIVQAHKGQIYCHNRSEGGAVFVLMLPSASEVVPANTAAWQQAGDKPSGV
ncbi:MAG: ATP-binding protein [Terriglobales bacterium]